MKKSPWELTIIDADPPVSPSCGLWNFTSGDFNGDGRPELIVGGPSALLCYTTKPYSRDTIDEGHFFQVGSCVGDIDGDGRLEVISSYPDRKMQGPHAPRNLVSYKRRSDGTWAKTLLADNLRGQLHDIITYDIDGDGELEIIANLVNHTGLDGLMIFDCKEDGVWHRHDLQQGFCEEGLTVFHIAPDEVAIASGVHVYRRPQGGPYSGYWEQTVFAPDHREMCRVKAMDITGNGVDDLIIVDSEYHEGRLSWVENRVGTESEEQWVEHPIEGTIYYGHSLDVDRDAKTGVCKVILGEMAQGGWEKTYHHDSRVMLFTTSNGGEDWSRELLDQGQGMHEAAFLDYDNSGELSFVGKEWRYPRITIWQKPRRGSVLDTYQHQFIDLDLRNGGSDLLAVDVDGDGLEDIVTGCHWYHQPDWKRYRIPEVSQVISAYDLDGDGKMEFIGTLPPFGPAGGARLSNRLVWLKPIDAFRGDWEIHEIGIGIGDWPHGSLVAPVGPGGKPALITCYHSAHSPKFADADPPHYPELWTIPDDPTRHWSCRPLADFLYGEEVLAVNLANSEHTDLILGGRWMENLGDGTFKTHLIKETHTARIATANIAGKGRHDLITGDEVFDYGEKFTAWSYLRWFECPGDPRQERWTGHVIDRVRCAHSISAADLDGDGQNEIIIGEHDPFKPCRTRCHTYIYKRADLDGPVWKRYTVDDRFEQHDGCEIINLKNGSKGIISIGWTESYVHLWAPR